MDFTEVVRHRHMVRTFTDEPVSPESLERILDNAVRGPSAGFSQGQAFLVLTGDDLKRFWPVAGAAASDTVTTAPLVIVPMSCKRVYLDRYALPDKGWTDRDETRWPVPFWHIDTGMAALLILLTVVDEGLGALYFGIVPEAVPAFREAFGVPDDHEPIGAIAIGHNAESAPRDGGPARPPPRWVVHSGGGGRRRPAPPPQPGPSPAPTPPDRPRAPRPRSHSKNGMTRAGRAPASWTRTACTSQARNCARNADRRAGVSVGICPPASCAKARPTSGS